MWMQILNQFAPLHLLVSNRDQHQRKRTLLSHLRKYLTHQKIIALASNSAFGNVCLMMLAKCGFFRTLRRNTIIHGGIMSDCGSMRSETIQELSFQPKYQFWGMKRIAPRKAQKVPFFFWCVIFAVRLVCEQRAQKFWRLAPHLPLCLIQVIWHSNCFSFLPLGVCRSHSTFEGVLWVAQRRVHVFLAEMKIIRAHNHN